MQALTAAGVIVRVWDKDWNLVGRIEECDLVAPDFHRRDQADFTLRADHPVAKWLIKATDLHAHLSVDDPDRERWCGVLQQWHFEGSYSGPVLRTCWRDELFELRKLLDFRDPLWPST